MFVLPVWFFPCITRKEIAPMEPRKEDQKSRFQIVKLEERIAPTSPGQLGYEGQPGNQGNGLRGYEGQPGNQGG
jgi:hypothetical protein